MSALAPPAPEARNADLIAQVAEDAFARRLNPQSAAPVAVAVSGGGDSVALLALADAWARRAGRRLLVLTVNHGLQSEGEAWCGFVADLARRCGADVRVLRWEGAKPSTGLPAAARTARHRLLAQAAREAGASVVLLGHTADDEDEAAWMRTEGGGLGRLREWSPSPAWPEGRGLFLLRPLLGCRRAELRAWLSDRDLPWIEDPANVDLRYARSRARAALTAAPSFQENREEPPQQDFSEAILEAVSPDGRLVLRRAELTLHALSAALLCAAGSLRPPRGESLHRLRHQLSGGGKVAATLAGARVEADGASVVLGRSAGEFARGGSPSFALSPGEPAIWDGRFELTTSVTGLTVAPLRGRLASLPAGERQALRSVPAWARGAFPAILGPADRVTSPLLASGPVQARLIVGDRLAAALGQVRREP